MPHCRTDGQCLTCGRGLPPPAGRLPGLPPRHRAAGTCRSAVGRQPPRRAKIRLKINFIYIKVPTARQEGGRGRPPRSRVLGVQNCKLWNRKYIYVKNDFKKYKNKKTPGWPGRWPADRRGTAAQWASSFLLSFIFCMLMSLLIDCKTR